MLAGLVAGVTVVVVWASVPELKARVYEIVPGFAASTLAVLALRGRRARGG